MKIFAGIFASIVLISCSHIETKELQEKEQTLELSYIAWACDCANWATSDDIKKFHDDLDSLANHSIFIEPAKKSFTLPDTLGYSGDHIKFTGQFYKKIGFPKGYYSQEDPDKKRVFRYTKYEVLKSHYRTSKQLE